MAAPVSHIFLALQFLATPAGCSFDEKEFLVGTSFPDIRYLKCVKRTETHVTDVTLDDIAQEKDSFKAGVLFHSFVDEKREAFMEASGVNKTLPQFLFRSQALKFAEDIVVMDFFDVQKYSNYFDCILAQETKFGILKDHIMQWHLFLTQYINKEFSAYDFIMKYYDINDPQSWWIKRAWFSWWYGRQFDQLVVTILADKLTKAQINKFYRTFTALHIK